MERFKFPIKDKSNMIVTHAPLDLTKVHL